MKDRKAFIRRFQNDEKKTGTKLSPDRKNLSSGYSSKNVRNIKESLNVGRHHVDEKKLANWRKHLKKYNIDLEDFKVLLIAKALESDQEILAKILEKADISLLKFLLDEQASES